MSKYTDVSKCRGEISQMAQTIIDMETSFDYSMKGFFIDNIVTEYVNLLSGGIVEKYEYILTNQKGEDDSYGDYDETFTKMNVKNFKPQYPDEYTYNVSGSLVKDIFQGNNFVVIKVIEQHKEFEKLSQVYYHIRKIEKDVKSIDYSKYVTYGDKGDVGYVMSITKKYLRDSFEIEDKSDGIYFYKHIRNFIWVIDCIYNELKENDESNNNN